MGFDLPVLAVFTSADGRLMARLSNGAVFYYWAYRPKVGDILHLFFPGQGPAQVLYPTHHKSA